MSEERDRARLIATYADDLIARRSPKPPERERHSESDLAEMLDLTRSLSEIELETPPELNSELLQKAREREQVPRGEAAVGSGRLRWSLFESVRRLVRVVAMWPVRHPLAASAVAVVLLLSALYGTRVSPTVSAAALLKASASAERARLSQPGVVAHRAFTLEARRLPESRLISKRHVELWSNPRARIKARRVFDERKRLLAGEWTNPDGSRVVYEPGRPPRRESATDPKPLTADTVWRWEPAASDFTELVKNVERVDARATADGYRLSFDDASGRIAQAELTLDRDHVPLAQIIVLRESGEAVEYRTARESANEIPEAQVAAAAFEPEAELLPSVELAAAPASVPALLTSLALDGLELQATYRLQRLADCLAEPGELRRDPSEFRVRVVVSSPACGEEARRGLKPLADTSRVSVDVDTTDDSKPPTGKSAPQAGAAPADISDEELKRVPAYPALYEFHARQALRERPGAAPDVDAAVQPAIRRFVVWARERSGRTLAHAQELERLGKRWPPETLRKLGLDSATMWQAMVRDQARGVAQGSEVLLAQLQPALGVASPESQPEEEPRALRNLTDVREAIAGMIALAASNDAALRGLLSPSQREALVLNAASTRLAHDLRRAVRLADRFAEPWSLEP